MLIHMENAMKAHQHISYTKRSFKKNNFNTKSEQNIHQDALHKLHI